MKHHTDTDVGHCQLAHAGLEEGTTEVSFDKACGFLEEAVGLVGIGKVGGGADHVGNLLGQCRETGCTGSTCCRSGFLLHLAPVYLGGLAREPLIHQGSLVGIGAAPCCLVGFACCDNRLELFAAGVIECLHVVKDHERIFNIATKVLDGVHVGFASERCSVRFEVGLVARPVGLTGTLAHDGLADDERGAALFLQGGIEGLAYLLYVVAVDLHHIPSPCLILGLGVLVHHELGLCGKLNVIGVVEHDEVVQSQYAGNATYTLRDLLLHGTVADIGVDLVLHHGFAKACLKEFLGNGSTGSHRMALTERA